MTPNLSVDFAGLMLKNPVAVASGTFAYGEVYDKYYDIGQLGAVVTKSLSLKPRAGNKPPRIIETPAGMLNAIGLQNVGIEAYLRDKLPLLQERNATIIGNIYGHAPEEYAQLAAILQREGGAHAIEANLSCPNVHDSKGNRGACLVGQQPEAVQEYIRAIKGSCSLPLIVKLTPNIIDIKEPALAAEEAGADAVSLINTLMGMVINPETRRPRLANNTGGLSGPAIRPVAVKMVWDCANVLKIPVMGIGGICTASDALEFLLAGALAVQVGSVSFRQPDAAIQIIAGIGDYLERHNVPDISELIGQVQVN